MKYVYILFVSLGILIGCGKKRSQNRFPSHKARPQSIKLKVIKNTDSKDTKTDTGKVDLNGDGTDEIIRFECTKRGDTFSLFINDVSITDRVETLYGYYKIVDIDSADMIKEISISESGPSDDYATHFYYYDGQKIIPMGGVEGANVKIDGSGVLRTYTRGKILHTWFYPDSYKLSKKHILEHIDKDLYTMNWSVTVKGSLPLQKSRTDSETIIILVPGERVKILSSDNKEWCLVENAKGIKGWFAIDGYHTIRGIGKIAQEIFEGLCYAD